MELFDTTYIIDIVGEDPGALKKAEKIDKAGIIPAIAVISVHEYLLGVHKRYKTDKILLNSKLASARKDLNSFEVFPFNREIAEVSSIIESDLQNEGNIIGINDIYIAATALYRNLKLVTRNISDFERIKGLKVETY